MNDIKVVGGELAIGEQTMRELKKLQEFQITIQEMKNTEQAIKDAILQAMEANGIKSFENDFVKITYIAPSARLSVDTAALKEQGLYEMFAKASPVGAQVRVKYK